MKKMKIKFLSCFLHAKNQKKKEKENLMTDRQKMASSKEEYVIVKNE